MPWSGASVKEFPDSWWKRHLPFQTSAVLPQKMLHSLILYICFYASWTFLLFELKKPSDLNVFCSALYTNKNIALLLMFALQTFIIIINAFKKMLAL